MYRLEYYFLNTTTDAGVPSCACVLVKHTKDGPCIALGGSAGFSVNAIILQSAREALAVLTHSSQKETFPLPEPYVPFSYRAIGRNERLALWRGERMHERLQPFLSGARQPFEAFMGDTYLLTTPRAQLDYVKSRLKKLGEGYEVYYYEAADPILKALGYHAVRAIVPKLLPLYLAEHMPTLSSERLKTFPEKLGLESPKSYTPWPHPFP
jgi:hypothetical protein